MTPGKLLDDLLEHLTEQRSQESERRHVVVMICPDNEPTGWCCGNAYHVAKNVDRFTKDDDRFPHITYPMILEAMVTMVAEGETRRSLGACCGTTLWLLEERN